MLVSLDLTDLYPTDTHHLNLHINKWKYKQMECGGSEGRMKENTERIVRVPVTASACLRPAVTLMTGSLKD